MPDCLNSWVFYLTSFKTSIIESPDNRSLTELGYLITLLNTAYTARRSKLMYYSNRKKSFFRGTELFILFLLASQGDFLAVRFVRMLALYRHLPLRRVSLSACSRMYAAACAKSLIRIIIHTSTLAYCLLFREIGGVMCIIATYFPDLSLCVILIIY